MVERGRPQMIMWRMRIVCWTNKATDTHSEYENLLVFHENNGYANAPLCRVKTYVVGYVYREVRGFPNFDVQLY